LRRGERKATQRTPRDEKMGGVKVLAEAVVFQKDSGVAVWIFLY